MNIEKLINKWQIDIANCEQIINHCSVTEKTMEFTKGELNAISDCLEDLKNLTIPVVRQRYLKNCIECGKIVKKSQWIKAEDCKSEGGALCSKCRLDVEHTSMD